MIFADDIPELVSFPHGFPGYWMKATLLGSQLPPTYEGKALMGIFVACVEAAFKSYREGRIEALAFFYRDAGSVPLSRYVRATKAFEECIGQMHRAVRCVQGIKSLAIKGPSGELLIPFRPNFARGSAANRIRGLRDEIQHNYERVQRGEYCEGVAFVLALDGDEVSTPTDTQPDQTLKTWDRLKIGALEVTCRQLVEWLIEMGDCAEHLAHVPDGPINLSRQVHGRAR